MTAAYDTFLVNASAHRGEGGVWSQEDWHSDRLPKKDAGQFFQSFGFYLACGFFHFKVAYSDVKVLSTWSSLFGVVSEVSSVSRSVHSKAERNPGYDEHQDNPPPNSAK